MGRKSKAKKERAKGEGTSQQETPATAAPRATPQIEVTVTKPVGGGSIFESLSAAPPEPPTAASAAVDEKKAGPGLHYALLAVLGIGILVALYLVRHKLKITLDPDYVSSCNLGGAIDCDRVNTSRWSELFGIPISLLAVPTYLVMGTLVWVSLRLREALLPLERAKSTGAMQVTALIALSTVVYSLYLAFVSSVWLRAYCLYCIGLYVVNATATVLAVRAAGGGLRDIVEGGLRTVAARSAPVLVAALAGVASAAVAVGGYQLTESAMTESYTRTVDERLAEETKPVAPASSPAPAQASPSPAAAAEPTYESGPRGTRGGKKTDDGYTYFEPALDAATEFWAGNPDATVTVVKYADFQCAYCRQLAESMKRVEEKYHDRVRFVMKHFPMNVQCNQAMRGFDKHPVACEAAYASHCAGLQGKFWPMHDLLYENQPSLAVDSFDKFAEQLGLDMSAFHACLSDPGTRARIQDDVESGLFAGIYGTPRTYINNRLVPGSAHAAILEYYIDKALEAAAGTAEASSTRPAPAGASDGRTMIAARSARGTFFIDPYENSIANDGSAVSQPDLEPTHADHAMAKEACEKAGKRLCTEEEWVSACSGASAIDDNGNKMFADDHVEGDMYPYGPYHEEGYCHDRSDERTGRPKPTGSFPKCRTPSGIFDLAGNISEWADTDAGAPTLLGGTYSNATGAACNRRTFNAPPGSRNHTTGFRCCADQNVTSKLVTAAEVRPNVESLLQQPIPTFSVQDALGNPVSPQGLAGKVTLVNFFASWCGPCKKELPHLVDYAERFKDRGFQVLGIGVDTVAQQSIDFAKGFNVTFPLVTDPEGALKGKFLVYEMPATFVVDRQGVIRYQVTGFSGADQEAAMRAAIEKLL
jgi:protein-disulfide isomerase/uncharacterized membrane protein/peroxiredoxin